MKAPYVLNYTEAPLEGSGLSLLHTMLQGTPLFLPPGTVLETEALSRHRPTTGTGNRAKGRCSLWRQLEVNRHTAARAPAALSVAKTPVLLRERRHLSNVCTRSSWLHQWHFHVVAGSEESETFL